jgi:GH25 family lysozyme M1 (1,4-beta-N-acetylmuramidase)
VPRHHAARITAVLGALLLGGLGCLALPAPPAAAAPRHGATGLHDGMMPAGAPDAALPGAAHPNAAGGGATPLTVAGAQTGVDVAHYQHPAGAPIDWGRVRAGGQAFAIVKATELYTDTSTGSPVLYTNPYLSGDLAGARAAGLMVGAYAFAHPENSATTQADDFAMAVGSLVAGGLPPVLDLEVNGGLTPAQLATWTQTFLNRLQADTGIVPMIYTGPNFWQTAMGGNTGFGRYPLWEAHYTTAAAPATIAGWTSYSLWQFADAGSVPGITGSVDMNRSNGPVASVGGSQASRADLSPVAVAAVRTTAGSLLSFVRGTDGAVWAATAVNGVFGAFQRIPSGAASGPAAVTANGSRVDLFVKGTDGALWHMALTVDSAGRPGNLGPWDSLGGTITTAPAAASSTSGRLLVSARGADGAVWSRVWNAGSWQPWVSDGGTTASAAAVDVVDANTYRAQVVHTDGAVWTGQFSAATGAPLTGWQPTANVSTVAAGASATASWSTGVRAVAYGSSAGVQQRRADGRAVNLGGVVTSGLALAESGTTSVWTLARGADNALWVNVSSGSTSTWSRVGGALA